VNYRSKYVIAFKGLKEGKHRFAFEIDEPFFDLFENSEVKKGSVTVIVTLTRQSNLLVVETEMKGRVELLCDRCLEPYDQRIRCSNTLYVKFGAEEEELNDDVIVLPYEEHQIDLAQSFYEQVILSLPIKRIHPKGPDGKRNCNPDMVEKLSYYLVDESAPPVEEQSDDRWKELKKLFDKQ